MKALFENEKLKIHYFKECNNEKSKTYLFSIEIKDFDTPILNLEYDESEAIVIRTWIDERDENIPKSHVIYKLFCLIKFEVCEIIKFMIKHI